MHFCEGVSSTGPLASSSAVASMSNMFFLPWRPPGPLPILPGYPLTWGVPAAGGKGLVQSLWAARSLASLNLSFCLGFVAWTCAYWDWVKALANSWPVNGHLIQAWPGLIFFFALLKVKGPASWWSSGTLRPFCYRQLGVGTTELST